MAMWRVPASPERRALAALRDEPERGSTVLLTIFYASLALVLVLLVTAATSLYLERKKLFTLADGAALVGAEAFNLGDVSIAASGPTPTLNDQDVASAVRDYLEATPTDGFEALHIEHAATDDGRSATVTLSAYWRPPIVTLFVPDGLRLEVTSVARSVFD
jgi:uncharacterized membrane protein